MVAAKKIAPGPKGLASIEDADDEVLLRWFFDAETDLDKEALRFRVACATALCRRRHDQPVTEGEAAFLDGVAAFAFQLVDGETPPAEELVGLAAVRSAHLGQAQRATHLVSLAHQAGIVGPHVAEAEALIQLRRGDVDQAAQVLAPHAGNSRSFVHLKAQMEGFAALPGTPWRRVLADAVNHRDPLRLVRGFFGKDATDDPIDKILGYLVALNAGIGRSHARVQSPRNVRRHALGKELLRPDLQRLVDFALEIEKLDEQHPGGEALHARLDEVDRALREVFDVEHALVGMMAIQAIARTYGYAWLADQWMDRYATLSAKLTRGRTNDALGLLVLAETRHHKAADRGRGAALLSGKIAARWVSLKAKSMFRNASALAAGRAEFDQAVAELLGEDLSKKGGWLQKVAQLGSGISGILPEQVRQALVDACYNGRTMSEAEVERILGGPPARWFKSWEPVPFAAGSVAQLHRATVDGRRVVVKIKHPGIEKEIERDIKAAERHLWLGDALLPGKDLKGLFEDWKARLMLECDLTREARLQERARRALAGMPGIAIPAVIPCPGGSWPEGTLVQELVVGESFAHFAREAPQARKNLAAERIMDAILRLIDEGIYYLDLHAGNFLFSEDTVHLVDFGGTMLREESGEGTDLRSMAPILVRGDMEAFVKKVESFGVIEKPTPAETDVLFRMHRDALLRPFLAPQPFTFTPEFAASVVKAQFSGGHEVPRMRFPRGARIGSLRIFWSLYALLGELRATGDWAKVLGTVPSK